MPHGTQSKLVISEDSSRWPSWLEGRADESDESNDVWILAQQADESPSAFEARVRQKLETIPFDFSPHQAILLCSENSDDTSLSLRASLLRTLGRWMEDRGDVILVADGSYSLRESSAELAWTLNQEFEQSGAKVAFRFRAQARSQPPPAPRAAQTHAA